MRTIILLCTIIALSVYPVKGISINLKLQQQEDDLYNNELLPVANEIFEGSNGNSCTNPDGSNYCKNGGNCEVLANGTAICHCQPGFEGEQCEENVCKLDTCNMHGNCRVDKDGNAKCTCYQGWYGEDCSKKDHCVDNGQCEHGQCLNSDTPDVEFICVCEPGWVGTNCDTYDYCSNYTCSSNGLCVNNKPPDDPGAHCNCHPGYFGDHCEYTNPCIESPNPCHNGGTCIFDVENPPNITCLCDPRYEGERCEIERVCDPPCQNGGVCAEYDDGVDGDGEICLCPNGYFGDACENKYDDITTNTPIITSTTPKTTTTKDKPSTTTEFSPTGAPEESINYWPLVVQILLLVLLLILFIITCFYIVTVLH